MAKRQETCVRPRAQQERAELCGRGRMHVAVSVSVADVARIEIEDFARVRGPFYADLEITVACDDASIATVGLESLDRHANGNTRVALLTPGAIEVTTAAPETCPREHAIQRVVDRFAGIEKQRARTLRGQIAARMARRQIELLTGQLVLH